jgi:hypothetical protein
MDWSIVTDWLVSHGVRILIIIVISFALYFVPHRLLPRALRLIELQAVIKADRAGSPASGFGEGRHRVRLFYVRRVRLDGC